MPNLSNKIDSIENASYYLKSKGHSSYKDSIYIKKIDSLKASSFFDAKFSTLKPKIDTNKTTYCTSIFTNHQLSSQNKNSNELSNNSSDWLFIIEFLGILIFTWVIVSFRKRLNQIFTSLFTNRAINQLIRDGDLLKETIRIPLLSIYFLSVSLLISTVFAFYKVTDQSFSAGIYLYLKILLLFITLYIAKILFIRLISNTFRNQIVTSYYLLNGSISNIIIGILLTPLLFLYTFSDKFISDKILIICIVIIILINVVRIVRNITSSFNYSRFSSLYLFLYLCTVELLPIMIIVKLINRFISF